MQKKTYLLGKGYGIWFVPRHTKTLQLMYLQINKYIERNEYWKFRESIDFSVSRLGSGLRRKERGKV